METGRKGARFGFLGPMQRRCLPPTLVYLDSWALILLCFTHVHRFR
jgi:hypothetical protein